MTFQDPICPFFHDSQRKSCGEDVTKQMAKCELKTAWVLPVQINPLPGLNDRNCTL